MNSASNRHNAIRRQHATVQISEADFIAKYANRVRRGKTLKDHKSGSWKARFSNREKPIRRTSNHVTAGQDNRGVEFWLG